MGTDYGAWLVVGFSISYETIQTVLGKVVDEKIRYEDRYDPKTGKKLTKKEKVVEPGDSVLVVPDGEISFESDSDEIATALGERFECDCEVSARSYGEVYCLSFSSNSEGLEGVQDSDGGEFGIGCSVTLRSLVVMHKKLQPLKKRLLASGFTDEDVGEPRVIISWSVDG